MRQRFGIIGAASLGLVAAAALRDAGYAEEDVLIIDDRHAATGFWPTGDHRPARAPRSRGYRQQYQGVLGLVLNNEPALATFTSPKSATKRQRRRARGKGKS